jgi:hypothetical protein
MSPKTSMVRCRLRTCEKKTSFFPSALAQGRLGWPVSLKHSKPYKHAIDVGNVTAPLLSPFTQQVPLNPLLHLSNNSCSTIVSFPFTPLTVLISIQILGNLKQPLAVSAKDLQKKPSFLARSAFARGRIRGTWRVWFTPFTVLTSIQSGIFVTQF